VKRFGEMDPAKVALVGGVVVVALVAAALNVGNLRDLVSGSRYSALFADSGGLHAGDPVRVSGIRVGKVDALALQGPAVKVDFTVDTEAAGLETGTRAAVRTENPLGAKFLELSPQGGGTLDPGAQIPLDHTEAPYDLTDALSGLTTTVGQIDTGRLATSLDTLATTFDGTAPDLAATLDGVQRLSRTIASRDEALRGVLAKANGVSGVLADRSAQITRLMRDGSALLAELENRRRAIHQLFVGVSQATDQVSRLVAENKDTLQPALTELRKTLFILNKNEESLRFGVQKYGAFARGLGEAVGSGPFFYAYIANLGSLSSSLVPCLPQLFDVGQPPGYGQPPILHAPPPGAYEEKSHIFSPGGGGAEASCPVPAVDKPVPTPGPDAKTLEEGGR